MPVNHQRKTFADFYIDVTNDKTFGNATQSAIAAKYSEKTAKSQGQRLLTFVDVIDYINAKSAERQAESVANRAKRQEFWTTTLNDTKQKMADRLRASELLGKSEADFVEVHIDANEEKRKLSEAEVTAARRLADISLREGIA